MQHFVDSIIRFIPMWLVILVCYLLGGSIVGLAGFGVNILMGASPTLFPLFVMVGAIAGLLQGIWALVDR